MRGIQQFTHVNRHIVTCIFRFCGFRNIFLNKFFNIRYCNHALWATPNFHVDNVSVLCQSYMHNFKLDCALTKAKISTKSDPGSNPDFRINSHSDLDVCRIPLKFCGFISLSASVISPSVTTYDCMLINLLKPYSTMVREVKKWSAIRILDQRLTSSSTVRPNHDIKFQWNRLITFAVILLTYRMKDLRYTALIA